MRWVQLDAAGMLASVFRGAVCCWEVVHGSIAVQPPLPAAPNSTKNARLPVRCLLPAGPAGMADHGHALPAAAVCHL